MSDLACTLISSLGNHLGGENEYIFKRDHEYISINSGYYSEAIAKYIFQYSNLNINQAILLTTEEGYESVGKYLSKEFSAMNIEIFWIRYQFNDSLIDMMTKISEQIIALQPQHLIVDITTGPRHISYTYFSTFQIAKELSEEILDHVSFHYAQIDKTGKKFDSKNLSLLLELSDLSDALYSFDLTGEEQLFLELSQKYPDSELPYKEMYQVLNTFIDSMRYADLNQIYSSWQETNQLLKALNSNKNINKLSRHLLNQLNETFKEFKKSKREYEFFKAAISWCSKYKQLYALTSLMVEGVNSIIAKYFKLNPQNKNIRKKVNVFLNEIAHDHRIKENKSFFENREYLNQILDSSGIKIQSQNYGLLIMHLPEFKNLYHQLNDKRNDIQHVKNKGSVKKLAENIINIANDLIKIIDQIVIVPGG